MSAGLMLRVIIGVPLIMAIIMLMVVGGQAQEPIYNITNNSGGADVSDMDGAEDAFGQDQAADAEDSIMNGTTVAGIALILVICGWIIFGALNEDVNQGQRRF